MTLAPFRNLMPRKYLFLTAAMAIWLVAVGGGMTKMWTYSFAAGEAGKPPVMWPAASHLHRSRGLLTLVMILHPHCPCSRASIDELAILIARAADKVQAYVIFVQPPEVAASWSETDLWKSVSLIHGVTRVLDDGHEARLLGAATSGQTIVYDARGNLRFSGGITGSRGHLGVNSGLESVISLAGQSKPSGAGRTPVYGCSLFSPGSKKRELSETCRR
jgi:hypothetical protein